MDASAAIRSVRYSIGTVQQLQSNLEKPGIVPMHSVGWNSQSALTHRLDNDKRHISSRMTRKQTRVLCTNTAEDTQPAKSNASLDSSPQNSLAKKHVKSTFPNGFEDLVLEVCDETEIAELQLKVGEFQMHLKRNVGATKAPLSNISPTTPPPIPTKPMVESVPDTPPPSPPKSSPEKTNPFINVPHEKSSKLAALEASGTKSYVLVSSPTVGSFQRGRTLKGKRQPPICKEGDVIKAGQVIGYLDQFGTELPVKSDVAGEVLKILFQDGEAVGYGDPLVAILPSFHDIK
ncbi:biotin carboxyl carrier protein of acetyl-CoA carboxylase, chloroplastic-like [Neltuma alba]|uniref:biotin carboxyl carrier protein of acetyl-CoA carboxylase, chloroplastic-like n=1 Tax=Neltuma alba TaxID=207710 RepID=UPI0010A518C7|nr:biotin carboxyl carrier protein of acetyl-CoA carboxylase, chloroplastic-like [Prosopis alba]XP_028797642.1 biotin carboxyl carrier protein of acetyl-CoA carboxylase, chloroplastic-like [Prosopis alba]